MTQRDIIALRSEIRGLAARVWHLEQDFRRFSSPEENAKPAPLPAPVVQPSPASTHPVIEHDATPSPPPSPAIDALMALKQTARSRPSFVPFPADHPVPTASSEQSEASPSQSPERLWKAPSPAPTSARPSRDAISFEWLVGGRVYAVLGALVIIAGVGLFLKLAWDRGWFAIIPDAWKCILSASFGAVLLGAGEVLRKKWGAIASIGCSAAGLGVMYAAAYAAYGVFHLVPHQLGFIMLAATAALGIVIGARARLVSIAVVAMLGAYLTPLFFLDVEPTPIVLPAYLFALLITGLTLCAHLGGRFVATRAIAWWGTVLLGGVWVLANATMHPIIACGFLALSWWAIQCELILGALRRSTAPDDLPLDAPVTRATWSRVRPFSVSFSTSAWAGFLGGLAMHWWHDAAWMATGAGFAATAMLGVWLGGHMRVLRDTPESDRDRLGVVFATQAGVFLIVTIALALAGWLEVTAWIAMGVAAIVAGRWMRARSLDIYGLITLALATGRLLLFDKFNTPALAAGADVAGLYLTRWSALVSVCALAWIATGELIRRTSSERSPWRSGSIAMQMIGALLIAATLLDDQTRAVSVAWFWLALGAFTFIVGELARRAEWRWAGATAVITAILAGAGGYEMWEWTRITAPPFMHPAWWFAITSAAMLILMGRRIKQRETNFDLRPLGITVACAGGFALFVVSSLEVARAVPQITDTQTAQRAAVSIWWGLCAVGMLAAGFMRRAAPVRYLGLALLGLATLKAVVFDLIDVSSGWRVASFVLLGVLMIGVAAVYTRLAHAFDASADDDNGQSIDETEVGLAGSAAGATTGE